MTDGIPNLGATNSMKKYSRKAATLDDVDAEATKLYDRLNPNWQTTINVSKAECVKRVLGKRNRSNRISKREKERWERRRLLRSALDIVRQDSSEQAISQTLVNALSKKLVNALADDREVTGTLLESASEIVRTVKL